MSKASRAPLASHLSSGWPSGWGVSGGQGHQSVCSCHGFMAADLTVAMIEPFSAGGVPHELGYTKE